MPYKRKQQFDERHQLIIKGATQLLLDSVSYDLTLDELAEQLNLAKGTLYKHFASKDELLLSVLVEHQKRAMGMALINDGASAMLARTMLFYLNEPQQTVMMTHLEERLTGTVVGVNRLFDELYQVRHACAERLLLVAEYHLQTFNSTLSATEYLSAIFAMAHGGATLLVSSFYQRFVGEREALKWLLITQALTLPRLYDARQDKVSMTPSQTEPDTVPKLIKPLLPPIV